MALQIKVFAGVTCVRFVPGPPNRVSERNLAPTKRMSKKQRLVRKSKIKAQKELARITMASPAVR